MSSPVVKKLSSVCLCGWLYCFDTFAAAMCAAAPIAGTMPVTHSYSDALCYGGPLMLVVRVADALCSDDAHT